MLGPFVMLAGLSVLLDERGAKKFQQVSSSCYLPKIHAAMRWWQTKIGIQI